MEKLIENLKNDNVVDETDRSGDGKQIDGI